MDDDAERGLIFVLGVLLGLAAMWLIVSSGEKEAHGS